MTGRRVRETPDEPLQVADSSAWLAYFDGEPSAAVFKPVIQSVERLVVPTICLLEVYKTVRRQRSEHEAAEVATLMQGARVVHLDAPLALDAARLGAAHRLATADSIVYATARRFGATLWTQDAHFDGLPGVRFHAKRSA